jgi:hypothetical protein
MFCHEALLTKPRNLPAATGRGEVSAKRKFKAYPIGYFHIDFAEVRTTQGKLYLLAAINRTSKFVFIDLHEKVVRGTAADFLRRLIDAVPYSATALRWRGHSRRHFPAVGLGESPAE